MQNPLIDTTTAENIIGKELGADWFTVCQVRVFTAFFACWGLPTLMLHAVDVYVALAVGTDLPRLPSVVAAALIVHCLGMSLIYLFVCRFRRLRVREDGLEVRHVLGWEFWPWARFASGDVVQRPGTSIFIDRAKFLTRRRLNLGTWEEARGLLELFSQHYEPPAPQVPEWGLLWMGPYQLTLNAHGILVRPPVGLPG